MSALRWADVADSTDGDGVLVNVRRSKTNQDGDVNDVRFVKDGVARALRMLRVDQPWRVDHDSRMVAHYSAGATAERGAVARYL